MENNKIIVVDFGSQYNQLIVRRIRDLGVYSELVPNSIKADDIKKDESIIGIVFSGGPNSVYEKKSPSIDKKIFDLGLPILGICYGVQLISHLNGGKVVSCSKKEYGKATISIFKQSLITKGLSKTEQVWMSHGDQVDKLPKGFVNNAKSSTCKFAIISNEKKKQYGIQFHPEVVHTLKGNKILSNFIFGICKAKKNWNMDAFIQMEVEKIKKTVGKDKVICALSGGVDSAVTAAIIAKAIGNQLTCFFVDHGLLRWHEAEDVVEAFKKNFNVKFLKIDAKKIFLNKLKGVSDPEKKRKIIGSLFIDMFEQNVSKKVGIKWLAQGTLYTDVIESGTSTAQTIKSHHNVGGLPERMKSKLIEPLNILFKDEVRELGRKLGLPEKMVSRQPFPGPGLAIRTLGEITEQKLNLVRESDRILQEEIANASLNKSIWQYFTVLPNVKTVGVKGDGRSYEDVIVIRAVTSIDGMTADFAKIPYDILQKISTRITNEIKGINRVVYDITQKPPGTIEWE